MQFEDKESVFKNLATLLSFLLPVAQVFATLLPPEAKGLILFQGQLLIVSVIAGLMAYMLIVGFRSTIWFRLIFNRKSKKQYDAQQLKLERNIYSYSEVQDLIRDGKIIKEPFVITPLNLYYFLVPTIFVFTITFLGLGIFFSGTHQSALILLQAVIYILLVSLTSLVLGVFYVNDINRAKRENSQVQSWDRVKRMLFSRQAIPEFPTLDFVAEVQFMQGTETRIRTIVCVNKAVYYAVDTNLERKHIYEINTWNPSSSSLTPLGDENE